MDKAEINALIGALPGALDSFMSIFTAATRAAAGSPEAITAENKAILANIRTRLNEDALPLLASLVPPDYQPEEGRTT